MNDDQFTRLFKYMEKRFGELHHEMDDRFNVINEKFDRVYGLLDTVIRMQEKHEQEALIVGHQLERHEAWFDELAEKTHTKLLPER